MDPAELHAAVDRVIAGTHTARDRELLRQRGVRFKAVQARGRGAMAAGRDIKDVVLVDGDDNEVRVFKGPDVATIRKAFRAVLAEDEAERRTDALGDYLRVLRAFCEEQLPYSNIPGWHGGMPALSAIYVVQHPAEQSPDRATGEDATARGRVLERRTETVEEALARHRHLVLEGGPGMGKTTLLRRLAATLAKGAPSLLVPVLVSARGMAMQQGSLSESLRHQAAATLGQTLTEVLPIDLFARPLTPGASWLVLVDGLDEVVSPLARQRLIAALRHHVATGAATYRFVVTTRPLLEHNALLDQDRVGHYVLRPFEPGQVTEFARSWFAARPTAQPEDPDRLARLVVEHELADLARVPLLLTMAAVVYEQHRGAPLPPRRADLYARFVDILLEDERAKGGTSPETQPGARAAFRSEWEQRFGHEGLEWADRLFNARRPLVEHLALRRQEGHIGPLVDEAVRHTRTHGWLSGAVDGEWLQEHMELLLQRTGLIDLRGEGMFLHETFQEYLAAVALAQACGPHEWQAWRIASRWREERWREVVLFFLGIRSKDQDITGLMRRIWPGAVWRRLGRLVRIGLVAMWTRLVNIWPGAMWNRAWWMWSRPNGPLVFRGSEDPGLFFVGEALAQGVQLSEAAGAVIIDALLADARAMPYSRADALLERVTNSRPLSNW